jgi:DNA-binding CsgD family transcriptional regulator
MQALYAAVGTLLSVPDDLAQLATDALAVARRGLTDDWAGSLYAAHHAAAEAYAARLDGRTAFEEWSYAVDIAATFGTYFALRPQPVLSLEQLRHGERDAGRENLLAVWRSAESMGARWFSTQAAAEARRHRVPLPVSASPRAGALDRLTPREHHGVKLLAQGATNRNIARTLFITERTAALHVSHILATLGVANRGEASALIRNASEG